MYYQHIMFDDHLLRGHGYTIGRYADNRQIFIRIFCKKKVADRGNYQFLISWYWQKLNEIGCFHDQQIFSQKIQPICRPVFQPWNHP